jgi:hypothetical protein
MGATSRREFLTNSGALGAFAASALFVSGSKAAMGPISSSGAAR